MVGINYGDKETRCDVIGGILENLNAAIEALEKTRKKNKEKLG